MRSALIALLLLAAPPAASSQVPAPRDSGAVIVVSGEGRKALPPDQVTIQLGVDTRARTANAAGQANAQRMTAVRQALLSLGLTDREVTTAHYMVRFEMGGPTMRDSIYVASNSVQIETKRMDLVSKIIDTALGAGATNINYLHYGLNDMRMATRDALADAVAQARLQAEAIAAAAGGTLGALLELNAQPTRFIPYAGDMAMMRVSAQAAETPVSPKDVTVTASVTGRWRFTPR
jgi:uncharacterized protein YggE